MAEEVYNRMIKHFPDAKDSLTAAAVLLANTVASSGDLNKATVIKNVLNEPNVKKSVGLSWTTVNGQFYVSQTLDFDQSRNKNRCYLLVVEIPCS